MFLLIMLVAPVVGVEKYQLDPATDQLALFKERTKGPVGVLTTSSGAAVPYPDATSTFNTRLNDNEFFMESITHINRERIPERCVHARGAGAFGYFEATNDISHICKAGFLRKGTKTDVVVRFSQSTGEKGIPDLNRDTRGFAVKFYTDEGNFDIPGLNTPMNSCNDPLNFASLAHAYRRNPVSNLFDANAFWDIATLLSESLHMTLLVFADRGIPASYRNMPGFGVQTYQVENEQGDRHFVRFHFMPDAGIKSMCSEEARNISSFDPDYLTRDLFRAIGKGDCPSWTVSVQILTESDVKKSGPRIFDVTRVIPLSEYPLHEIGKLVLNRNPKNYFADMVKLAFNAGNLVPGITGAPGKVYESRRFAYRDAQYYRLGANYNKIPVNCPFQVKTYTYDRDGSPPVKENGEGIPNYYPNSFYGPVPYMTKRRSSLMDITEIDGDNIDQARELYTNEMEADERSRLIENLVFSLRPVRKFIQQRAIKAFTNIHPDLGNRVALGLKFDK